MRSRDRATSALMQPVTVSASVHLRSRMSPITRAFIASTASSRSSRRAPSRHPHSRRRAAHHAACCRQVPTSPAAPASRDGGCARRSSTHSQGIHRLVADPFELGIDADDQLGADVQTEARRHRQSTMPIVTRRRRRRPVVLSAPREKSPPTHSGALSHSQRRAPLVRHGECDRLPERASTHALSIAHRSGCGCRRDCAWEDEAWRTA
jgi:hypothetical protein